jgi:hypothetical protein
VQDVVGTSTLWNWKYVKVVHNWQGFSRNQTYFIVFDYNTRVVFAGILFCYCWLWMHCFFPFFSGVDHMFGSYQLLLATKNDFSGLLWLNKCRLI